MTKKPRFDFNFSYWIFIWFLLYWNKYIKYSPKIWFILAIILNTIEIILMIYFNNPILNIFLFFIINSIIKIYPLYLLRNNSFKIKDFLFGLVIFSIYSIWLFINNTNFINILKENFINIKNKKIATPGIYYIIKFIKDNKITF
jgi:hypothetical protein